MKYTMEQRTEFERILNEELDANDGILHHERYEERLVEFLHDEHDADRLPGLIPDLAKALRTQTVKSRTWDVTAAQQTFDLFQPEALLALGNNVDVRMSNAAAEHLVLHRQVLEQNFAAVKSVYRLKDAALGEWIPRLQVRGCTLGELEGLE